MGQDDLINKLPTDLHVSILSRLTLKEAIATSVLSRQWEKLWTFYHGSLDFEVPKGLHEVRCLDYAGMVKKVLGTFERVKGGGVFDSFTIRFHSCRTILSSVNRSLHFAMKKRMVKRLEFNSFDYDDGCYRFDGSYDFLPLKCFYAQTRNIRTLTYICFRSVNVSCEIIEHFLSNCPDLQSLELSYLSYEPLNYLKVSGETLPLRHLIISDCPNITTIEISAPNLVSFEYYCDGTTQFYVRNVPKLVKFSTEIFKIPMTYLALRLLRCFSHIQKLLFICNKEPVDLVNLSALTSLEHLTLKFSSEYNKSLLAWTPLLKAFPVLQKLTLDMQRRFQNEINPINGVICDQDKLPGKCLKVLEFLGFSTSDDIEFVMYLLKYNAPLEKIILGCNSWGLFGMDYKKARNLAGKLKQMIPEKINLEVFDCPNDSFEDLSDYKSHTFIIS